MKTNFERDISPDELEHLAKLRRGARPKLIEHTEIDSLEKWKSKFLRTGWLRRQRDDRSMVRDTCNWSDLGRRDDKQRWEASVTVRQIHIG